MDLVLYLGMPQDFLITFKGICPIFIMLNFSQCQACTGFKDKSGGTLIIAFPQFPLPAHVLGTVSLSVTPFLCLQFVG